MYQKMKQKLEGHFGATFWKKPLIILYSLCFFLKICYFLKMAISTLTSKTSPHPFIEII